MSDAFKHLLDETVAQIHDDDPAGFHGDAGDGDCPRCTPPAAAGGEAQTRTSDTGLAPTSPAQDAAFADLVADGQQYTDPDAQEPDYPAAVALARHIADQPLSTLQAAFRLLNRPLSIELHDVAEDGQPAVRLAASGPAAGCGTAAAVAAVPVGVDGGLRERYASAIREAMHDRDARFRDPDEPFEADDPDALADAVLAVRDAEPAKTQAEAAKLEQRSAAQAEYAVKQHRRAERAEAVLRQRFEEVPWLSATQEDLATAEAAVAAVRRLHHPINVLAAVQADVPPDCADGCGDYPCDTIRAIEDAINPKEPTGG